MVAALDHDLPQGCSLDAFHRGRFHLVQPRKGHRAGMDALVLAAAIPDTFAALVADLGAGSGAAALAVLSRCGGARALLVERDETMLEAARETLARPENTAFSGRATVLAADVALSGAARERAGLAANMADAVIMNPPFNASDDRASADPVRRDAHVLTPGLFEAWLRTAATIARPRGWLALIARPQSLAGILAALDGRFGSVRVVPVHARPGEEAIRIVLRARKGSRGALSVMPPLMLHESSGNGFAPRAERIINGLESLFGD